MKHDRFTLTIELGNDAMRTRADVGRALAQLARSPRFSGDEGKIRDENGNTVGSWRFEESEGK